MITKAMKKQLIALQYTQQQIHKLTPLQAHGIIKQQQSSEGTQSHTQSHTQSYTQLHSEISEADSEINNVNIQSNTNLINKSESLSDQIKDKLSEGSITVCAAGDNILDKSLSIAEQPQVMSAVEQSAENLDSSPKISAGTVNKAAEEYLALCVEPDVSAESVSSIVLTVDNDVEFCEELQRVRPQPVTTTKVQRALNFEADLFMIPNISSLLYIFLILYNLLMICD